LKRISIPGDPDPAETIFSHVILALERSELKEESRAEKAARYQALAKTARNFSIALMGSELDHAPYHWFQDKVILRILGMMRPELASGTFCLLDPFPDTPKDTVFREISNKPGSAHVATSVGIDVGTLGFFQSLGVPRSPVMSQICMAVAAEADLSATNALTERRVLPKPGVQSARRIRFVRELGSFFKTRCRQYLKRTLASFATAALQEDVTPDQVADALRDFEPPSHRPWYSPSDRPRAGPIPTTDPSANK
jgi:hypothetical protein